MILFIIVEAKIPVFWNVMYLHVDLITCLVQVGQLFQKLKGEGRQTDIRRIS
jgi:hypothetical protein